MKYMGSKNRIAKHILPIMLAERKHEQWWVEPFVGGANMIDKVTGNRIGNDSNKYLISLLKEMQKDEFQAPIISKEIFEDMKTNPSGYEAWKIGFAGFQLSYGAMWFGSYRRDNIGKRNYAEEAKRNVDKQAKNIKGVLFLNKPYLQLDIPKKSLIYCDPPYANTAKYKAVGSFNHDLFWQWCRGKAKEGHTVFISEYSAPDDFECVWQKEIVSSLTKNTGAKRGTEKLFRYKA
jgi:DNA adenine methylase